MNAVRQIEARGRGFARPLLLACALVILSAEVRFAVGQSREPLMVAPGVWFLLGDAGRGYSNTAVIEMKDYLVVVDANYPGRAVELQSVVKTLSQKPVKYVFDTHAHGDHSYGNAVWTKAGATTVAFQGVASEMERWEPGRWRAVAAKREDVRETGAADVERPKLILHGDRMVLRSGAREVDFLFLGWGHTPGDGYVWLPRERILCTGDAAVNGPRNKLLDASIANWPKVLEKAIRLGPKTVLPGHGDAGGMEILTGQKRFLEDLYGAVAAEVKAGKKPAEMMIRLPEADGNWVPARAEAMQQHVEATYAEIVEGRPAGALPHEWK